MGWGESGHKGGGLAVVGCLRRSLISLSLRRRRGSPATGPWAAAGALRCIVARRPNTLHCSAMKCIAPRCIALHLVALHCTSLHCIAPRCIALHLVALHCSATNATNATMQRQDFPEPGHPGRGEVTSSLRPVPSWHDAPVDRPLRQGHQGRFASRPTKMPVDITS
jgi:hypothetical protein